MEGSGTFGEEGSGTSCRRGYETSSAGGCGNVDVGSWISSEGGEGNVCGPSSPSLSWVGMGIGSVCGSDLWNGTVYVDHVT